MSKSEELKLTKAEFDNLQKAFKDEEFRRLFAEYANEISDPESRKLYEEEISQMEKNKDGGSVELIRPQANHVLKVLTQEGNAEVFVNICSSSMINTATSKSSTQLDTPGYQWSVPHCSSRGRAITSHGACSRHVIDVTFHGDTLKHARENVQFRNMLHSVAMDAAEKQLALVLDRMCIEIQQKGCEGEPEVLIHKRASDAASRDAPDGLSSSPIVPSYTIVHRNHLDWQDFTITRSCDPSPQFREIEVRISLPLKDGADGIDLDVTGSQLTLASNTQPQYHLHVALPCRVLESKGLARFDKSTKTLHVTLPVDRIECDRGADRLLPSRLDDACGVQQEDCRSRSQEKATILELPKEAHTSEVEDDTTSRLTPQDHQREHDDIKQQQQQQMHVSQDDESAADGDDTIRTKRKTRKKKKRKKKRPNGGQNGVVEVAHHGDASQPLILPASVVDDPVALPHENETERASLPPDEDLCGLRASPWEVADLPEVVRMPPFSHCQNDVSLTYTIHVDHVRLETVAIGFESNQAFISFPCESTGHDSEPLAYHDSRNWCLLLDFDRPLDSDCCGLDISEHCVTVHLVKHNDHHGYWNSFRAGSGRRTLKEIRFQDDRKPTPSPCQLMSASQRRQQNEGYETAGVHPPSYDVESDHAPSSADDHGAFNSDTAVALHDLVDDVVITTDDDDDIERRSSRRLRSILKRSNSEEAPPAERLARARTLTAVSDACLSDRSRDHLAGYGEHRRRRVKSVSFGSLSTVHEFKCLSSKEWKRQMKTRSLEDVNPIQALTTTTVVPNPLGGPPKSQANGSNTSSGEECHQGGKQRKAKNKKKNKNRQTNPKADEAKRHASVSFSNAMIYELDD